VPDDAAHRRAKQKIVKIALVTGDAQHRANLRPMPNLMKQDMCDRLARCNRDHHNHEILLLRYIPPVWRKGFDKFLQTVPTLAAKLKQRFEVSLGREAVSVIGCPESRST
jgi:hypothetical protein